MPKAKHLEKSLDDYFEDLYAARDLLLELPEADADLAGWLDKVRELQPKIRPPKRDKADGSNLQKLVQEFIELEEERIRLEALLKKNAEDAAAISGPEGPLMTEWMNTGTTNVTMNGRTVFVHSERWLFRKEDVKPREAVIALRRARLGALTSEQYNAMTLRSWLKEREESGRDIPPIVKKHFKIEERTTFRSRKAR